MTHRAAATHWYFVKNSNYVNTCARFWRKEFEEMVCAVVQLWRGYSNTKRPTALRVFAGRLSVCPIWLYELVIKRQSERLADTFSMHSEF